MKKNARSRSRARRRKRYSAKKAVRNILLLLAAISLYEYYSQGQVRWPMDLYARFSQGIDNYATRPGAAWRKAADALENLGAAREGQSPVELDLQGRVVRVADGDTLSVLDRSGRQHTIRLYGIDTPERDQRHGASAKRALSRLVESKTVGVSIVDTDDYGRSVSTVYLDGANINLAMVEQGHAWWYRRYAPYERHLELAQKRAREEKRGLWADPEPEPPWSWRRGIR